MLVPNPSVICPALIPLITIFVHVSLAADPKWRFCCVDGQTRMGRSYDLLAWSQLKLKFAKLFDKRMSKICHRDVDCLNLSGSQQMQNNQVVA